MSPAEVRQAVMDATGITDVLRLEAVEGVMRTSIYLSSLNWQTQPQIERAAHQAVRILDTVEAPIPEEELV